MLNISPFQHLNGSPMLPLNSMVTYVISQLYCGICFYTALYLQFAFNTLLSLYRSFTVKQIFQKNQILSFLFLVKNFTEL